MKRLWITKRLARVPAVLLKWGRPACAGMTMLVASASWADASLLKNAPDFLPVDQAFEIQPLEIRNGKLVLGWRIAKNYYLYRHRLKFTLVEPAGAQLGTPTLPEGEKHEDEHFGQTEIYRNLLEVQFAPPAGKAPVKVQVVYQGCADAGLCYPPQTRVLDSR